MKRSNTIKKCHKMALVALSFILFLVPNVNANEPCDSISLSLMKNTWREFRDIHPFSFQTVGLKHKGDTCVFVISEPAEWVKRGYLKDLFIEYNGHLIIGRHPFGYDGRLYDAVGLAKLDSTNFVKFENMLFALLYGEAYKPYYTDLDHPSAHVYYSNENFNLNVSEELITSILNEEKLLAFRGAMFDPSKNELLSQKSIDSLSNLLYYSKEPGFVIWRIPLNAIIRPDNYFRCNARRFALDADLVLGAYQTDSVLYIVARERKIPVSILPPLRSETIQLLSQMDAKDFSLIISSDSLLSVEDNIYATPVTTKKRVQGTELGNLMLMTDLMLKSWSEKSNVVDYFIDYPLPHVEIPFHDGVAKELGFTPKYLWGLPQDSNSDGYIVPLKTGSLSPSYIGTNDSPDVKDMEVEEKAYQYFSSLNNPELVRIAQYALIYKAFQSLRETNNLQSSTLRNKTTWQKTPSMTVSNSPWGYGGIEQVVKKATQFMKKATQVGKKTIKPVNQTKVVVKPDLGRGPNSQTKVKPGPNTINKETRERAIKVISTPSPKVKYEQRKKEPRIYKVEERGFDPQEHIIQIPPTVQRSNGSILENVEYNGSTKRYKDSIREKVFRKTHKINKIEMKSDYTIICSIKTINYHGKDYNEYAA